jgi:hypothetical protein
MFFEAFAEYILKIYPKKILKPINSLRIKNLIKFYVTRKQCIAQLKYL